MPHLYTHGNCYQTREWVPPFAPKRSVVEALKKFDPNLDVKFMYMFGGRLAIVEKIAYTAHADRDEMSNYRVIMVITRDDGGPRQIEMTDVHRMRQAHLHSWGERWHAMKDRNARADAEMEERSVLREQDYWADWSSTRVYWGDPRSPRNGGSSQYICEHRRRNVDCPLCRPDKKSVFRMGSPSGEESNGYESIDLRDHEDLLQTLKSETAMLEEMNKRKQRTLASFRN